MWPFKPNVQKMADEEDIAGLTQCLRHKDEGVRVAAAGYLSELQDPSALTPLCAALEDPSWEVADAAVAGLAGLGALAVQPVCAVLSQGSLRGRRCAARVLAEIADEQALQPLLATLKSSDWDLRDAAATGLAHIGRPAMATLLNALKSPETPIRRGAARALGEIGNPEAIDALCATLADPQMGVREAAADALARMGPAVVGPVCALVDTLQGPGTDALDRLLLALMGNSRLDDQARQRIRAARDAAQLRKGNEGTGE